ncbi:hypothetical protein JXD20_01940 [Candidatus Peregrinibacteria bacterium]|nr:hypothetical protein [Candidatus Peregrinibacteria bacterium]
MKKKYISLIIILFLPLALLAGCGKDDRPDLADRVGTNQSSYEGVIESLENLDVYQQGTHKLVTRNDGTIVIQSPTINLNRYLDEEVRVEGRMTEGIGDAADVFSVSEIAYLDASKQVELTDYENKVFGFRFSHPSTWLLDEGAGDLGLKFEENEIVSIAVFSDETDLDAFAASREDGTPTEVTIGAQRALRFVDGAQMGFYVPNPPKKKIYLIKFSPSEETQLDPFYDLLDSFELIYLSQLTGDKCGGLEKLECPEKYICQLESDSKYAEGICVPIDGESTLSSCPYIAVPACNHYRISEYSQRGCPTRYECVTDEEGTVSASYRDLNTVDAGERPEDYEPPTDNEETENSDDDEKSELQYEVPEVSDVTMLYANDRAGFSLLMPRTWYYASFGVSGGVWKVGFADFGLEEPEEAIITLSLLEEPGGKAYKKIGDAYYVFDGPADLTEVMEKMADSVEESD